MTSDPLSAAVGSDSLNDDRDALAGLVAEFEAYLEDSALWSNRRMKAYRERFHDHGVWVKHPAELLAAAKELLRSES